MNATAFSPLFRIGALAAICVAPLAHASITQFVNNEAGWLVAAGAVTTVDCVEESPNIYDFLRFDHFAAAGLLLSLNSGNFDHELALWVRFSSSAPQIGASLSDDGGLFVYTFPDRPIEFRFLQPIHAFAVLPPDHDGVGLYSLFREGQPVGTGAFYATGSYHNGLYSTEAFDEIRFDSMQVIDNVYFQTIPAPGALSLIGLAAGRAGRRWR